MGEYIPCTEKRPDRELIPVELFVATPPPGFDACYDIKFKFRGLVYKDYHLLPWDKIGVKRGWFTTHCCISTLFDVIPDLYRFVYDIDGTAWRRRSHDCIEITEEGLVSFAGPVFFIEYWDIGGDLLHVAFKKDGIHEDKDFEQHFLMSRYNLYTALRQAYCDFGRKGGWRADDEQIYEWSDEEKAQLDANLCLELVPVELFVKMPLTDFSTEFVVIFKFGELVYSDYKLLPWDNSDKERRWFSTQCTISFTHDIIEELHNFLYDIYSFNNSINIREIGERGEEQELFIECWSIGGDLLHVLFKKIDGSGNNIIHHFLMTRSNLYNALRQVYCYFGEKGGWKLENESIPYVWNDEEKARLDANLRLK